MNIIIPMAGMGKRLRPHTLSVPKPLLWVAGKPIVLHLAEDLTRMAETRIKNIYFVTGRFGAEAEESLLKTAERLGAVGHIRYQDSPLGTAHAVNCAREGLEGPVIVAFADTLFRADFRISPDADGVLFVKYIDNPEQFGVIRTGADGRITEFHEKPKTHVSNLAMIGIYAIREGALLRDEIDRLIANNITKGGEYQLPDAFEQMVAKGLKLIPGEVSDWMDCGNFAATVQTNSALLAHLQRESRLKDDRSGCRNSVILEPCCIGDGAQVNASVIGPFVTIGPGTKVEGSVITNSLIAAHSQITCANIQNSMIGNHTLVSGMNRALSLGDYSATE